MKPFAVRAPGSSLDRSPLGAKTQGFVSPVVASRYPPQNERLGVNEALKLDGSSGSIQVHCRPKLDLKLCTPTMANMSQKKPIKNETLTRSGAAFLRLRRIIYPSSQYALESSVQVKNAQDCPW